MTIREQIVAEARSWENTPYCDGQGVKGADVDCAYFPLMVYKAVGLIPREFTPPLYSPQQWLNSPRQTDKVHLRFEDKTFLNVMLKFADHEVFSSETFRQFV